MPRADQVFARFHAVATGTLRLPPEVADEFASHVARADEGIHVVGQLCATPNALQSSTLGIMLERWLRLLPEYEMPARVLAERSGAAAPVTEIGTATALLLHARVFEVGVSQLRLAESQALQFATHVQKAASAFYLLEQLCRAVDRHPQKKLLGALRAALGEPLAHASEAAAVICMREDKA